MIGLLRGGGEGQIYIAFKIALGEDVDQAGNEIIETFVEEITDGCVKLCTAPGLETAAC